MKEQRRWSCVTVQLSIQYLSSWWQGSLRKYQNYFQSIFVNSRVIIEVTFFYSHLNARARKWFSPIICTLSLSFSLTHTYTQSPIVISDFFILLQCGCFSPTAHVMSLQCMCPLCISSFNIYNRNTIRRGLLHLLHSLTVGSKSSRYKRHVTQNSINRIIYKSVTGILNVFHHLCAHNCSFRSL